MTFITCYCPANRPYPKTSEPAPFRKLRMPPPTRGGILGLIFDTCKVNEMPNSQFINSLIFWYSLTSISWFVYRIYYPIETFIWLSIFVFNLGFTHFLKTNFKSCIEVKSDVFFSSILSSTTSIVPLMNRDNGI